MSKYKAISGNTSKTITGCDSPQEALAFARKEANDCMDYTDDIAIYDMAGDYLIGDDDGIKEIMGLEF